MFHEQKPPSDEGESKIERREDPPKQVVRVFLFQSEDPKNISPETPIDQLNFTRVLFIRKGGEKNHGQLMPPGGTLEKGETPRKAAMNEIVEETLLRFPPKYLRILRSQQDYHFVNPLDQRESRHAFFARAKLLPAPLDIPYVLDPEEDKIESFESLSLEELRELLKKGYIERDGERLPLLDSLWKDEVERQKIGTNADQEEIENVHKEILLEAEVLEAQKKLEVLFHLLRSRRNAEEILVSMNDIRHQLHILDQSQMKDSPANFLEMQRLVKGICGNAQNSWENQMKRFQFTSEEIKEALAAANVAEGIHNLLEGFSRGEEERKKGLPSLHLLLPLLLGEKLDLKILRVLKDHSQTANLFEMMRILYLFSQYSREPSPARQRRLSSLCQLPLDTSIKAKHILHLFRERKWLHNSVDHDLQKISDDVNNFLDTLRDEADVAHRILRKDVVEDETSEKDIVIDQVNEVKSASLEELCDYAFGDIEQIISQRDFSEKNKRLLRWEAQRKLLLMLIYHEAISLHDQMRARGIKPIEDIERLLETKDSQPNNRALILDGKKYSLAIIPRVKTAASLFRKMIVRDNMTEEIGRDIFGESLIFTGTGDFSQEDLQNVRFDCHPYNVHRMGKRKKVESLQVPMVIARFLTELFQKGGKRISIEDFKPFDQDPIGLEHSLSPGSRGEIRFWKWDIVHTDENDVKRYREIQVFLPFIKSDPISGEERIISPTSKAGDYERKKIDDNLYKIFRLFDTRSLRSFMELFFPAEIYGNPIRKMYEGRVSTRSAKIARGV